MGTEIDWRPKKEHHDDRVDFYSHPGTMEVIYADEWVKKKKSFWEL